MDVLYMQFAIFLIVQADTSSIQSNLNISEFELTQIVSSTSSDFHTNATKTPLQNKTIQPVSPKLLENTSIFYFFQDSVNSNAKNKLSKLIQLIVNTSHKPLDLISNKSYVLGNTSSKSLFDLFGTSEVILKTSPEPLDLNVLRNNSSTPLSELLIKVSEVVLKTSQELLELLSNNFELLQNTSLRPLFDHLFIKSKVVPISPTKLDLYPNNSQEQPEVYSTSNLVNELLMRDANGTIVRRQGVPKYHDILYSKPPNRYYGLQVATHKDGSTVKTTTSAPVKFNNTCDYEAYYCFKVYTTGVICARTLYYEYHSFPNICLMEYTNCFFRAMEWHLLYMGYCVNLSVRYGFYDYPYHDDAYLSRIRVLEDANSLPIDLY